PFLTADRPFPPLHHAFSSGSCPVDFSYPGGPHELPSPGAFLPLRISRNSVPLARGADISPASPRLPWLLSKPVPTLRARRPPASAECRSSSGRNPSRAENWSGPASSPADTDPAIY